MHTMTKPDGLSKPTEETLVARARAMIPTIAGRAPAARRERRVPAETILDMEAAGFFRILQPARWGGYEMKPQIFYEVLIALAEADMSTGWVYGVLGVHPWLMGLMEDRAVHDVWGDDDTTRLCSSLMPVGRAEPVEGGFRLTGHWRFSSGCDYAKWALLGAAVRTEPDSRRISVSSWCHTLNTKLVIPGLSPDCVPPAVKTSSSTRRSSRLIEPAEWSTTFSASAPGKL